MWWGKSSDKDSKAPSKEEAPTEAGKNTKVKGPIPFDPNKLPEREKLPPALQKIVEKSDREENFFDELVDG